MVVASLREVQTIVDLVKLLEHHDEENTVVAFLQREGILRATKKCNRCKKMMSLMNTNGCKFGKLWRCTKCKRTISIARGSFYENIHLDWKDVIYGAYAWSKELTGKTAAAVFGMRLNSMHQIYEYYRDKASFKLIKHPELFLFGGPGSRVQIDEACFAPRKYNRGKLSRGDKKWELEACEAMLRDDVLMRANVPSTHDNMNTAQAALNVHTLCRICAEAGEHMEEIFGATQLHTKINLCLPIKVCESDSLSLSVCHSCVARLENSFELATQSQRSDVILRDLQQRQNEEQRQIQVQIQNEEQKHEVAVSQISAVNSPVSNMDWSQTSRPNSPSNCSTLSERKNDAENSLELNYARRRFIDTYTIKVERDVSESSQEQMRNDDTNLQDINLEPQFCITNENNLIEENHRAAGCDVRIKTEADESCSNLNHVPIDNEILQDEDEMQNEITSELIIKSEHVWSDVEESRDNVHGICDVTQNSVAGSQEKKNSNVALAVNLQHSQVECDALSSPQSQESVHRDLKIFECKICNKKLKSQEVLSIHSKIHSEFKCKECKTVFKCKSDLLSHNSNQQLECSKLLLPGSKVHSDDRRFCCEICNKKFKNKSKLSVHSRVVHSDAKPFGCNICGKLFKRKGDLNYHSRVHSDVRPFQCKLCSKSFKWERCLKVHIQHHSYVRSFECKICNKMFKTKSDLSSHNKVHSGVKSFECKICSKMFKRKNYLLLHSKKVHSYVRPLFKCNDCQKLFKSKDSLPKHMLKQHIPN